MACTGICAFAGDTDTQLHHGGYMVSALCGGHQLNCGNTENHLHHRVGYRHQLVCGDTDTQNHHGKIQAPAYLW